MDLISHLKPTSRAGQKNVTLIPLDTATHNKQNYPQQLLMNNFSHLMRGKVCRNSIYVSGSQSVLDTANCATLSGAMYSCLTPGIDANGRCPLFLPSVPSRAFCVSQSGN